MNSLDGWTLLEIYVSGLLLGLSASSLYYGIRMGLSTEYEAQDIEGTERAVLLWPFSLLGFVGIGIGLGVKVLWIMVSEPFYRKPRPIKKPPLGPTPEGITLDISRYFKASDIIDLGPEHEIDFENPLIQSLTRERGTHKRTSSSTKVVRRSPFEVSARMRDLKAPDFGPNLKESSPTLENWIKGGGGYGNPESLKPATVEEIKKDFEVRLDLFSGESP